MKTVLINKKLHQVDENGKLDGVLEVIITLNGGNISIKDVYVLDIEDVDIVLSNTKKVDDRLSVIMDKTHKPSQLRKKFFEIKAKKELKNAHLELEKEIKKFKEEMFKKVDLINNFIFSPDNLKRRHFDTSKGREFMMSDLKGKYIVSHFMLEDIFFYESKDRGGLKDHIENNALIKFNVNICREDTIKLRKQIEEEINLLKEKERAKEKIIDDRVEKSKSETKERRKESLRVGSEKIKKFSKGMDAISSKKNHLFYKYIKSGKKFLFVSLDNYGEVDFIYNVPMDTNRAEEIDFSMIHKICERYGVHRVDENNLIQKIKNIYIKSELSALHF